MATHIHQAKFFHTLSELLEWVGHPTKNHRSYRFWVKIWKDWKLKNPKLPYMQKCPICSGEEQKMDIKLGKFRPSTKMIRKIKKEILDDI